uniref:E3 ubiquitin-protein ligase XIAP n=1 Tax=Tetraodon nigroviridis TaxID=99883 RepID=H3DEC4_TETNG
MEDQRHDNSNLETDSAEDFSLIKSRLESFRGSSLVQRVPAERLARAGFYLVGPSDRVRCFSCQKTVENWSREDRPVERHKEVSPVCQFLSCIYGTRPHQLIDASLANNSAYNEEAVVDESIYPVAPHMKSEKSRLQTFSSWPSAVPVRPQDLAQAGLYYLGQNDQVQCFCCGGILANWDAGDSAWGEHNKHFPSCFFILGHDVGNIPLQGSGEEEKRVVPPAGAGAGVHMGTFEERLRSFANVQHPVNTERLARAGFYSKGTDAVLCFSCNGGLKGWRPEEDPWEEHARHYPGCRFLLTEKGQEFVNSIQLRVSGRNTAVSQAVQDIQVFKKIATVHFRVQVIRMDFQQQQWVHTHTKVHTDSSRQFFFKCETAAGQQNNRIFDIGVCPSCPPEDDPKKLLQKLQCEKMCKICLAKDICIVFIPCGHLIACEECSESLVSCPVCCGGITQKVKTFLTYPAKQ